ncbi:hypothetical protein DICPUDRAFT_77995 [Dictyostelium purpureum]|uniref:Enoyl-CoA hydratase/isomerase domain-containing protein n=1 Tax=Dictyostelium purpureum TaxID=5786 RepID=F0ZI93_DICPU|nr:uncharacterized protein DICPUDRAFT_77995 [Dictyostelium purpureum]EGC36316.1 hypothetical protein DICPUDRAFT_77995 [Dictyostelium purpureum]|eukprot:XP_003287131.1 hypothetical protein DICPUDRAFT_77995 [Dictyostelium purpureum]
MEKSFKRINTIGNHIVGSFQTVGSNSNSAITAVSSGSRMYSKHQQDKSKDFFKPSESDLQKLYKYQESQEKLNSVEPFHLTKVENKTLVLTLNRPKSLNVLNTHLFVNLNKKFQYFRDDPKLSLMIIKGNGRAYCAGGDIKELSIQTRDIGLLFPRYFFSKEYNLDYTAATVNKPRVAFWDGIAMGGGLGISVHSPYRIVTEKTVWAMPEVSIGLFPDVGASYFLSRLKKDAIANYIAITGKQLTGADCVEFGIATHFVKSEKLPELEKKLIALVHSQDVNVIESVINEFASPPPPSPLLQDWSLISQCFSNRFNSIDEIMQALIDSKSQWGKDIYDLIRKKSPTSVKIAFRQIKEGAAKSLEECFFMEFRLAIRSLSNNEFIEGVRSVVIDKDQKPKWDPPTLEETSDEYINHYFSKLPKDQEFPIGDDKIYMP